MRYKKTFFIFLIALILLNLSIIYATKINNDNVTNYFRVHVVANSDSIDDQLLKYTIAKEVNNYINNLTSNLSSKDDCKLVIEKNIHNILKLCNNIIQDNNYNYTVKAYIGQIEYDEKNKSGISMKAGIYDSLKIVIGNGNGQNWWSLIYPTSFQEIKQENVFDEDTKYSFKIFELVKNLFDKI